MEVSARKDFLSISENQRIVCRTSGFSFNNSSSVCERIAHCPVYLWHATQTVGVLYARIVFQMRPADLAALKQLAQMTRNFNLAGMWSHSLNAFIKRYGS